MGGFKWVWMNALMGKNDGSAAPELSRLMPGLADWLNIYIERVLLKKC
jgi:hypothetical protein